MEAHIYRLKTFNNGGDGWVFLGPHDSIIVDGTSFLNGGRGLCQIGGTTDVNKRRLPAHQFPRLWQSGGRHPGGRAGIWANTVQGENNRSPTGGIVAVTHYRQHHRIEYHRCGKHRFRRAVRRAIILSCPECSFMIIPPMASISPGWRNLLSHHQFKR